MGVLPVPAEVRAILLDIEGTTTPIAFVQVRPGRLGSIAAPVVSPNPGVAGRSRSIAVRTVTSPALAARLGARRGAAGTESRDPISAFFRIMLTPCLAAPWVGWGAGHYR